MSCEGHEELDEYAKLKLTLFLIFNIPRLPVVFPHLTSEASKSKANQH
jgi:hypothetical protein